ncbi:unnamed protein product, partial [Ectocarpus fasciculatus]
MSNSMRELGGLVDNLYISSQQQQKKHPQDLPGMMGGGSRKQQQQDGRDGTSTPTRARKTKSAIRGNGEGAGRGTSSREDSENMPVQHGHPAESSAVATAQQVSRTKQRAATRLSAEKKRFNTTLSKPSGGSSLTGKRWNLSCFTMGKPIGKGRFGNVYLAREKASMKVLALKIMLKKDLEAAGVYHQVKSEIDIHVNYGSGCPNIVRCYGYFYDEKRIFIVMEYARKGELYRTMKAQPGGRFTESVSARYIFQLVRALQYLHGLNVIHRDIKPENLLLDKAGNLRLCDFGWSIEVADYDTRQTICGTQDYLAPEMLMERPYTTSVDLWAAGVVTYEFLLGHSPFRSESGGADTLSRIERGSYAFPEDPAVSDEAQDFVSRVSRL